MTFYKSKARPRDQFFIFPLIVFALGLTLGNVGCTSKSSLSGQGDATFVVLPITATHSRIDKVDAETGLPRQLSFDAKICLQDVARLQPVIAQSFSIGGGPKERTVVTDALGCLYWTESVDFNYLQPETMIQLDRTISALGMHRGTVNLSMALNPWLGATASVVDVRTYAGPLEKMSPEHGLRHESEGRIFVQDIALHTFNPTVVAGKTDVEAQIKMSTRLTRQLFNASQVTEPLEKGQFHVDLYLIEMSRVASTERGHLLAQRSMRSTATDGILKLNTHFVISSAPRADSDFKLLIRTHPEGGAFAANIFEGQIYFSGLLGDVSAATVPLTEPDAADSALHSSDTHLPSLDAYLAQLNRQAGTASSLAPNAAGPLRPASTPADSMATASRATGPDGAPRIGFDIDSMALEQGAVVAVNDTGTAKKIQIRAQACLKDAFQLKPVALQQFQVAVVSDLQAVPHFTLADSDTLGCVRWQLAEEFNYHATSHWISHYLIVRAVHPPYEGVEKHLQIYVNPWQSGSLMTWDARYGAPPEREDAVAPQKSDVGNKIQVSTLSYLYIGREFELDAMLNLRVKRKYQVRFTPMIARRVDFESGSSLEPLRSGHLTIRSLLLAQMPGVNVSDEASPGAGPAHPAVEPLTFDDANAEVIGGSVTFDLTLPVDFRELPLLSFRNQLVMEISSPKDAGLTSGTLSFPFTALDSSGTVGTANPVKATMLDPSQLKLAKVPIAQWKTRGRSAVFQKHPPETGKEIFESMTGFSDPLKVNHDEVSISYSELRQLATSLRPTTAQLSKFCGLIEKSLGALKSAECRLFPIRFLKVAPQLSVLAITAPPQQVHGDAFSMSVAASFGQSYDLSSSKSRTRANTVQADLGAKTKIGAGLFGTGAEVGVGVAGATGYTWATTSSQSSGKERRMNLSEIKNLFVEKIKLSFRADVNECIVIMPVDPRWITNPKRAGFHICRPERKSENLTESWFYINEQGSLGNTALRDLANPLDTGWIKVVRGEKAFARIRETLQDSTKIVQINHGDVELLSEPVLGQALKNYSRIVPALSDNNVPGSLDPN